MLLVWGSHVLNNDTSNLHFFDNCISSRNKQYSMLLHKRSQQYVKPEYPSSHIPSLINFFEFLIHLIEQYGSPTLKHLNSH